MARTQNPKFVGGDSKRVKPMTGMNVGGNTDAQVRINQWSQGTQLSRQLKKDKSAGMKVP